MLFEATGIDEIIFGTSILKRKIKPSLKPLGTSTFKNWEPANWDWIELWKGPETGAVPGGVEGGLFVYFQW